MKGSAGHPAEPFVFHRPELRYMIGANRTYTMIVEVEVATIAKQVSLGGSKKPASHDRLCKSDSTTEILPENGIGSLAGATMEQVPACPAYAQLVEDSGAGLDSSSLWRALTACDSSRSISRKLGISKVRINGRNLPIAGQ